MFNFDEINIIKWVEKLLLEENIAIILKCESLKNKWNEFKNLFNIEVAAGGKVLNDQNEVLFIFRNGKDFEFLKQAQAKAMTHLKIQ